MLFLSIIWPAKVVIIADITKLLTTRALPNKEDKKDKKDNLIIF